MNDPVIEMTPHTDPSTGAEIWTADPVPGPGVGLRVTNSPTGDLVVTDTAGAPRAAVQLTRDRFAGKDPASIGDQDDDDWIAAAGQQASGRKVVLSPTGDLVITDTAGTPQAAVELTRDRFAAGLGASTMERQPQEEHVVVELRQAGVAWISYLKHSTRIPGMPAGAPVGWLYRPRPNRYGDQLACLVAFHRGTGLYHAHYWQYEADLDGSGRKAIDLPRYLGRAPHLTHHRAHLYTGTDGSAVLCLSERVQGGMPTFDTALMQTMKWADGTGDVVRGRPFPYR